MVWLGHVVLHGREMDHGERIIKHCWLLLVDASQLSVVTRTIHKEPVDVNAILWSFLNLIWLLGLLNLELPSQQVDSNSVLSCMRLQHSCQEALWEIHAWQPIAAGVALG